VKNVRRRKSKAAFKGQGKRRNGLTVLKSVCNKSFSGVDEYLD